VVKKCFLWFLILITFGIPVFAQVNCNDIIYTEQGKDIIFDCCIKEVKGGNIVYYTKGGDTLKVTAVAITKSGQYIDLKEFPKSTINQVTQKKDNPGLYRGHSLKYYKDTYEISKNCEEGGVIFTISGILCQIGGLIAINQGAEDSDNIDVGKGLIYAGYVFESIGIPLWISGSIKKANNQNAIDEIERNRSLSIGITKDGIGICLHL
jgi:hypothetical protein